MGLFSKKPRIDPEELAMVRREMTELRQRLDISERARSGLEIQLQQLDAATASLAARSHLMDDVTHRLAEMEVLKRQVAQIDVVNAKIHSLDSLNGKLAELADRVTTTSDDAKQAKQQAAALHERISNVTTELANQLGELSTEMDGLAASQASAANNVVAEQPVAAEVLEKISSAQVKLANDQVRYEIAFRHDLAALADQLRKARTDR